MTLRLNKACKITPLIGVIPLLTLHIPDSCTFGMVREDTASMPASFQAGPHSSYTASLSVLLPLHPACTLLNEAQ